MNITEYEITKAFDKFVTDVKALVAENYATNFPTLAPDEIVVRPGHVYWKIIKEERGRWSVAGAAGVYGFVRKSDGAIFMPASWKAPAVKGASAIRGYVTDDDAITHAGPHGIRYAV